MESTCIATSFHQERCGPIQLATHRHFLLKCLYQAKELNGHVIVCKGIDFVSSSNSVVFWNCSNSVVFWNCSNSVVFWNCSNSAVFIWSIWSPNTDLTVVWQYDWLFTIYTCNAFLQIILTWSLVVFPFRSLPLTLALHSSPHTIPYVLPS